MMFLVAAMLPAGGTVAQTVPVPQEAPRTIPGLVIATSTPIPSPARTPVPVPTAPVQGLTFPATTPRASTSVPPAPSPTPATDRRPKPERRVADPRSPSAAPAREPTPAAATAATQSPAPTVPTPPAGDTPTPATTASPAAPPLSAPVADDRGGWPWVVAATVLAALLAAGGWLLFRRRPRDDVEEGTAAPLPVVAMPAPPASLPPPSSAPLPPIPTGPSARIDVALRPLRAGLNMLSAVVEAEVVVTNVGDALAAQVRINATLLSAHAGQEADLAATFAAPAAGRPAAPPFALAVGEERRVRVIAALSREALRSMEAGGRPMFVPLLAIDVRYAADADGVAGRTGQAFVVGVERVDSAKLAPFWLDAPLRMYDQIAARLQGAAVVG